MPAASLGEADRGMELAPPALSRMYGAESARNRPSHTIKSIHQQQAGVPRVRTGWLNARLRGQCLNVAAHQNVGAVLWVCRQMKGVRWSDITV